MFNQNLLFVFVCLSYIYIRKTTFYILLGTLLLFSLSSSSSTSSSKKKFTIFPISFFYKNIFYKHFRSNRKRFLWLLHQNEQQNRTVLQFDHKNHLTTPNNLPIETTITRDSCPNQFSISFDFINLFKCKVPFVVCFNIFYYVTWLSLGYDNKNNYINEIANFIPFSSDRLPFDPIWHCLSVRSANCNRHPTVAVDTMTIHHFEN